MKNTNPLYVVLAVVVVLALCVGFTGVFAVGAKVAYDNGYRLQLPAVVSASESPSPVIESNPSSDEEPANPETETGALTNMVNGKTVDVFDGEAKIATLQFSNCKDNNPTEWLNQRPGIGYLYQSGINNSCTVKVTLFEGGSFAADGDQFVYGNTTLGKVNDKADALVFADTPGVYTLTGWSFGLAVGNYRASDDKAGNVYADRIAATGNDGRPVYYLPSDGGMPKEVGK